MGGSHGPRIGVVARPAPQTERQRTKSSQAPETRSPAEPSPGTAPIDQPLLTGRIFQLAALYRHAMGRRLKEEQWLADVGFRPPCIGAIMTIAGHQPLSQRELSGQLRVDPSDLVNVIDILERAGFVSRERDPHDRRRYLLRLTDDGGLAVRRLRAMLEEVDDEVLHPLTPAQRLTFRRLLDGVVAHHL
jgi:DNA-binding MarR family transcriptional regulator